MSWTTSRVTRRAAIRGLAATGLAMPSVFRAHAAAAVEDPVHRGLADSGLTRYLPDRVGVGHATFLMDF